jgi:alkylation response protein AidB-like acyl-CoA dehydrogenase
MIDLSELRDTAQKAFPADQLMPDRDSAWKLAAEMGWLMIDLPETQGGLGLGREATTALHHHLGRLLSRAPLIPAMLGLQAMAGSSLVDRDDWIARIIEGTYLPLNMLPAKVSGGGELTGTISGVFEADMASHVVAGLPDRYLLIPLDAPGVTLVERPLWDESRRLFDIQLDGYSPGPVLAEGAECKALHDALSRSAQLALAADSLGGAEAALAMTVDYLSMRRQFDRPLAMFQALKHRCADLRVAITAADALMSGCARDPDTSVAAMGAMKALACDTYRLVSEEAIQLHGGIGLTQEHGCHHFMKRAMLNLQLCGSVDHWRVVRGREALADFG